LNASVKLTGFLLPAFGKAGWVSLSLSLLQVLTLSDVLVQEIAYSLFQHIGKIPVSLHGKHLQFSMELVLERDVLSFLRARQCSFTIPQQRDIAQT